MPNTWFVDLMQATTSLMTTHSALFLQDGRRLFIAIAIIMFAWQGTQYALAAASGRGPFRFDQFVSLVMHLAFAYSMIEFYEAPLPGVGKNFPHLIIDQGFDMAGRIEQQSAQEASAKLDSVMHQLMAPSASLFDIMEVVRYFVTTFTLMLAQVAMFAVLAWGYIATSVCVLVGPICIPFFLVPYLDWVFWSWFKALLQYSFYPVIGQAVAYVFGKFLLNYLSLHPPPWDAATIASLFLQNLAMSIAIIWGILKIPSLVSSIFSGQSGEHAMPGIGWWR